jgi:hypothetical protein
VPNASVHRRVGRPIAATYALFEGYRSPVGDPLIEALGGFLGGGFGASCPDWLEPGCGNHRHPLTASRPARSWFDPRGRSNSGPRIVA